MMQEMQKLEQKELEMRMLKEPLELEMKKMDERKLETMKRAEEQEVEMKRKKEELALRTQIAEAEARERVFTKHDKESRIETHRENPVPIALHSEHITGT